MGSAVPRALARYADAVHEAVDAAGYGVYDTRAHRTGAGLISVKVEVRTNNPANNTRGGTEDASKITEMRAAVMANLSREGHEVSGVRSSWFDWGRGCMGENAVTFYLKPRENG